MLCFLPWYSLRAADSDKSKLSKQEKTQPAADKSETTVKAPKHTTETLRGKVVWMGEALKRRFDVKTDEHAAEAMVVLETPAGELHPIVPDQRGRAFMIDPRLRDIDVELNVRRYQGSPLVQVMRIYHVKDDGRYEVDYWCDICAIPMYILKQCECCQGPTRLRERRVDKGQEK